MLPCSMQLDAVALWHRLKVLWAHHWACNLHMRLLCGVSGSHLHSRELVSVQV